VAKTRKIFLTGFPGFIASRLVEKMAGSETEFYLLVQSVFLERAKAEIEKIVTQTGTPLENFTIVEGDITLPGLGIEAEDSEFLAGEITEIFHLAAIYDLEVAREPAYAVNLEGTKNVNAFAGSIRRLERYNYISTCYVAGKRTGRILETELEHDAGFRNHYEETKYLAELEVERLKGSIPTTIFRPSVVVGDSHTGETAKYDGIYYLILYLLKSPGLFRLVNVGNERVRLNLVPVDFVVDGIAALSADERAVGKTIALADPEPLPTADLFNVLTTELVGKASIVQPPASVVELLLNSPVSPAATGLPHSGVPSFFLDQTYDTAIADEMLSPHGIKCPSFRDYTAVLIDFVKKHPRL
jgi:thioester reductase-like protein